MIDTVIFLLTLAGFALLHLAMVRHQQDWLRRKLPPSLSRMIRSAGFAALACAFIIAGAGFGWGYGATAWFGWSTVAAALVVALNTNRARILKALGS